MIAHLQGMVSAAGPTWAVLDMGGFGTRVLCTPSTAAGLRVGEQAKLFTTLVVREDSLTLYGFAEVAEREAFELLISASGVGPRLAQAVLSVLSPAQLSVAISREDLAALCSVPGIGRKGAQKLVIELKDKVAVLAAEDQISSVGDSSWRDQVIDGLQGLGYSARDAEAACDNVAHLAEDDSLQLGALMRAALATLAKR